MDTKPKLCLRNDCHHHGAPGWTAPAPAPRPTYAAADPHARAA